ncbi:MAG: phosphoribosyl-AMP cyclohydrolase [Thermodesulfovibrio sp.]|nr:phosphoribosyl-AMP cyclohydrolase [Thermodesulfovibrio sp.]
MIDQLKFDEKGLIPAVIQEIDTKEVLMVAYMDREALRRTLNTGYTHFWSRSRQKYWKKGETSGNVQEVKSIYYDCDSDCLLVIVKQHGSSACHTGNRTCFYRQIELKKV